MATEEFKLTMETLLSDYLSFRDLMKQKGHSEIILSFKDYLDAYINCKDDLNYDSDEDEDEDEEYIEEE